MNQTATQSAFGDYNYDGARKVGWVDGIEVDVVVDYDPPAREIGVFSGEWCAEVDTSTARIVDRQSWDDAHPGVEPTPDVIDTVVKAAADKIESLAIDYAADHDGVSFDEPDYDSEDY